MYFTQIGKNSDFITRLITEENHSGRHLPTAGKNKTLCQSEEIKELPKEALSFLQKFPTYVKRYLNGIPTDTYCCIIAEHRHVELLGIVSCDTWYQTSINKSIFVRVLGCGTVLFFVEPFL